MKLRYRAADPAGAEQAGAMVLAALDRLEAELGDREYLVGDSFTVADLTAAALFYPLVRPPEGPQVIETPPEPLLEWWAPHAERPGPAVRAADVRRAPLSRIQPETSTIASTSTGTPNGSWAAPIAERA